MNILLIADKADQITSAILSAVNFAKKLDAEANIDLLIATYDKNLAIEAAKKLNIDKIFIAEDERFKNFLAEDVAKITKNIAKNYDFIITTSNNFGKNFIPYLGALLNIEPITDIIKIIDKNNFARPIYAGNAIETLNSENILNLLTFQDSAFEADNSLNNNDIVTIEEIKVDIKFSTDIKIIEINEVTAKRISLENAAIVIAGGRGIQSKENFNLLYEIADLLPDCAVGASRAAVDAGYIANEYQIGQTGKIIAPNLYLACGISGAIQHLAGIKYSKIIAAINKDENAPIFEVADYYIVADLFEAIQELKQLIINKS